MDVASASQESALISTHELAKFQEYLCTSGGSLEYHCSKGPRGREGWFKVWLVLILDAWYIKRRDKDISIPEGAKRWRGANGIKLTRKGKVWLREGDDNRTEIFVQCVGEQGVFVVHRFRAADLRHAAWWQWAFEYRMQRLAAIFDSPNGATQIPSRPDDVKPMDDLYFELCTAETLSESPKRRAQRLRGPYWWLKELFTPILLTSQAARELSEVVKSSLSFVPFAGAALSVVFLGITVAAAIVKAEGTACKCQNRMQEIGWTLVRAFKVARDTEDEKFRTSLCHKMDLFEGAARKLEEILFSGRYSAKVIRNSASEVFENLKECDIELLRNTLESHERRIQRVETSVQNLRILPDKDEFSPPETTNVSKNPEEVILHLDDPGTPEGKLKALVLTPNSEGSTIVVAGSGMGGVGKTCALREIAHHDDVRRYFTDGVYWLSLGADADDVKVVNAVAAIVRLSSYRFRSHLAEDIKKAETVDCAMTMAEAWFRGKRCLFICDDLWPNKSSSTGYFQSMKRLIESGNASCMLLSTRDENIAQKAGRGQKVQFKTVEIDEAREILCGYARIPLSEIPNPEREDFDFVCDQCAGLKLTLAVAGSAVKSISQKVSDAWRNYRSRIESLEDRACHLLDRGEEDHPGLFAALWTSLEVADEQPGPHGRQRGERRAGLSERYRALCVLGKQMRAPKSMLANLWDVSEFEAVATLDNLVRLNLAIADYSKPLEAPSVEGLQLHDLTLQFCELEARKEGEWEKWHSSVLDGYRQQRQSPPDEQGIDWWDERIEDDGYYHVNVTRHLVQSKRLPELGGLLLNFQWTMRQLEVSGFLALDSDFQRLATDPPESLTKP